MEAARGAAKLIPANIDTSEATDGTRATLLEIIPAVNKRLNTAASGKRATPIPIPTAAAIPQIVPAMLIHLARLRIFSFSAGSYEKSNAVGADTFLLFHFARSTSIFFISLSKFAFVLMSFSIWGLALTWSKEFIEFFLFSL